MTSVDRQAKRATSALELGFDTTADGQTFIGHQHASYPFHVCRALRYPDDPPGMATVYIQSSSGGIYEGERLGLDIELAPGAFAHLTTQASTIVHSMNRAAAAHETRLRLGSGALLEYLPDPLILFPRARLRSTMRLTVPKDACALLCDAFLAHDPAGSGRRFECLVSDLALMDEDGTLFARDRYEVSGASLEGLAHYCGLRFSAHGSMVIVCGAEQCGPLIECLRDRLAAHEEADRDVYCGASSLPSARGVWVRILALDGAALRRVMTDLWATARTALTGLVPAARRK